MERVIEHVFRELPFGIAIAMMLFLAVLLMIWLLLPLWVLFIQWNTAKTKDEIRRLADLMEKKRPDDRGGSVRETKD
jgi:hypothetical protein